MGRRPIVTSPAGQAEPAPIRKGVLPASEADSPLYPLGAVGVIGLGAKPAGKMEVGSVLEDVVLQDFYIFYLVTLQVI